MTKYPEQLPHTLHPEMCLNVFQAANLIGLAANTLNQMRYEKRGPKFEKRGKKVVYKVAELYRWIKQTN